MGGGGATQVILGLLGKEKNRDSWSSVYIDFVCITGRSEDSINLLLFK